jgi:tetratricopeptide (TPR) repeat protein
MKKGVAAKAIIVFVLAFFLVASVQPHSARAQVGSIGAGLNITGLGSVAVGCIGSILGPRIRGALNRVINTGEQQVINIATGGVLGAVPVSDASQQAKQDATTQEEQKNTIKERCLDKATRFIVLAIMDSITAATVNWINTGFNGKSFYVENLSEVFTGIASDEWREFGRQFQESDNPLRDIVWGVVVAPTQQQLFQNYQYTLNEAFNDYGGLVSVNQDGTLTATEFGFPDSFATGGWLAYTQFARPQNNAFGLLALTQNALGRRLVGTGQSRAQQASLRLTYNAGFLDWQQCTLSEAQALPEDQWLGNSFQDLSYLDPSQNEAMIETTDYARLYNKRLRCVRTETMTPGKYIADQINVPTDSALAQLQLADEFNENLGLIADALILQLFDLGFKGLDPNGNPDSNSENYSVIAAQLAGLNPGSTNPNNNGTPLLEALQDVLIPQQQAFVDALQNQIATLEAYAGTVHSVDYCVPGPTPSWQNKAQENINTFLENFIQPNSELPSDILAQQYAFVSQDIFGISLAQDEPGAITDYNEFISFLQQVYASYQQNIQEYFVDVQQTDMYQALLGIYSVTQTYEEDIAAYQEELVSSQQNLDVLLEMEQGLINIGTSDPENPTVQGYLNTLELIINNLGDQDVINQLSGLELLQDSQFETAQDLLLQCQQIAENNGFPVNERKDFPFPVVITLPETDTFNEDLLLPSIELPLPEGVELQAGYGPQNLQAFEEFLGIY